MTFFLGCQKIRIHVNYITFRKETQEIDPYTEQLGPHQGIPYKDRFPVYFTRGDVT